MDSAAPVACEQRQPTVLARKQVNAVGIAVDSTAIYWSTAASSDSGGGIWKMPIGGGDPQELASADVPMELVLDSTTIYAASGTSKPQILAVPKAGGPVRVVSPTPKQIFQIAIDERNVYWTDDDAIHEVPLVGGTPTTVATANIPMGIAVTPDLLLWTSIGDGSITAAPLTGGGGHPIYTGGQSPSNIVLLQGAVVFTDYKTGTVVRVDPAGTGVPLTLASGLSQPESIATDGTFIYWMNEGDGSIMRRALDGGAACTLATGQHDALSLQAYVAVDATSLYWTDPEAQTVSRLALR